MVPGIYQVRLTVDGQAQSQSLKVIMDPRSPATPEVLRQQLQLAQEIFAQAMEARRALAEVASVKKQLSDIEQKLDPTNQALKAAVANAQSAIAQILSDKKILSDKERTALPSGGLQDGYVELTSALRVAESGDRAVPSQAVAVYKESSQKVKEGIAQWTAFKQAKLPPLNQKLREAGVAPVAISEIEKEVQFLMSR